MGFVAQKRSGKKREPRKRKDPQIRTTEKRSAENEREERLAWKDEKEIDGGEKKDRTPHPSSSSWRGIFFKQVLRYHQTHACHTGSNRIGPKNTSMVHIDNRTWAPFFLVSCKIYWYIRYIQGNPPSS